MRPDGLRLFRGSRVLVTGDTGFKGSWLALWLHLLGAEVVGYALPPRRAQDHFRLLALDKKIHHINGDIRDARSLRAVLKSFQPVFLFHLAAQSLVKQSFEAPKETFDVNVGGTVNVLEAARVAPRLRSLVCVTSDKCYRNKEWVWGYRENDELGGADPYSASKAAAEMVFSAYQESFFSENPRLGAATVRAGNVIGGGDWSEERIVPDCIRALLSGRSLKVRQPLATRPWQHVLDPLFGYLTLAVRLHAAPGDHRGAWNFGPSEHSARTVQEVVDRVVRYWGATKTRVLGTRNTVKESSRLTLNSDKARHFLKWRVRWDFETAVRKTVEWYRARAEGQPALEISRRQIEAYQGADRDS